MRIKKVKLKNFRNYRNETIYFKKKSVLIGSNDSGKTNLLYALRLVLDDSLPESKLMPSLYDFNFYSRKKRFEIIITICDIHEECILAKMKGSVSEQGRMLIKMSATYEEMTGKRDYELYLGDSMDNLSKIDSRYYLRVMNLRYIESARDLEKYIQKEKSWLLEKTKENRSDTECSEDEKRIKDINTCLNCLSEKVSGLNYVKKSTDLLNENLKKLSNNYLQKEVAFSTIETDSRIMIDRLALSAKQSDNVFKLGGDGFSNQTHLSLWAARNTIEKADENVVTKITIYCIEEVEAHLHPHHQRILARFMHDHFENNQVIITTHSPQIASQFRPESIVSLWGDTNKTVSFKFDYEDSKTNKLLNFGYRMNALSAEIYFAEVVYLVEGPLEVIFYKALAKKIGIDIDYYNISIIDVGGIGFAPYCDLAYSLGKEIVIRTDRDISKVPKRDETRMVGLIRALNIAKKVFDEDILAKSRYSIRDLTWFGGKDEISSKAIETASYAIRKLKEINIFISDIDLENDIVRNTSFGEHAKNYFDTTDDDVCVYELQRKKAINMYKLLMGNGKYLAALTDDEIAGPLHAAKKLA